MSQEHNRFGSEVEVVYYCDQCHKKLTFLFDGEVDYRKCQATLRRFGWQTTKVNGQWRDFHSESCRNKYIKRNVK